MEYLYGALLLHSAGKEITAENVTGVLKGAGLKPDDSRVKALVAALEGIDIKAAIEKAAVAPVAAAAPAATEGGAVEEKKDEEKEEKKEEEKRRGEG